VVARPIGTFKTSSDYHYQTLRCNVDLLRLIQIGLCFCDAQGRHPEDISTWQFNFKFSIQFVGHICLLLD
jgi:CCR4-NOT transcription complex subunit 7/8